MSDWGRARVGSTGIRLVIAVLVVATRTGVRRARLRVGATIARVAPSVVRRCPAQAFWLGGRVLRVLLLAVVPSLLLVQEGADASTTSTPADDPIMDAGIPPQELTQLNQWQAWITSPQAEAARVASRTAYQNQNAAQAEKIDSTVFPGAIGAPGITSLAAGHGAKVLRQFSATQALVSDSSGHKAVVASPLPLNGTTPSGATAPLDLGLTSQGGSFVTNSALVPLSIPAGSGGQLSFPGQKLGVGFASGASVAAQQAAGSVLYPNVATDTDVAVRAIPLGADISYVLRSPASPQSQTLTFTLPSGWSLANPGDGSGSVAIVSAAGTQMGRILPPLAADAQGQTVPASYHIVNADQLTLTVSHQSGDYAYPIQVDPTVVDYPGNNLNSAWTEASSDSNGFLAFGGAPAQNESMWMMIPNTSYQGGEYGEYKFTAPAGAYVYALDETVDHHAIQSLEYGGIETYNGGGGNSGWEAGTWTNETNGNSGSGADHWNGSSISANEYKYCARSGCTYGPSSGIGSGSTHGNFAIFGLQAWNANTQPSNDSAYDDISDATVYLADSVIPTITSVQHNGAYSAGEWWSNAAYGPTTDSVVVNSSVPNGLGIQQTSLGGQLPSADDATDNNSCGSGLPPCPMTQSAAFSFSTQGLPEGTTYAQVAATGAGGNSSSTSQNGATWPVNIDNTPPSLTLSGQLATDNGQDVTESSLPLQISATDSSSTHGTSGVTSLDVLVDGNSNDASGTPYGSWSQSCASGGCSMSKTWTMDTSNFGAGSHTIEVDAYDQAGNESTQKVTIKIHDSANANIGPGSVNLNTGELTLSATDVSVPTFSVPLTVSRTHLSRHPSAGAGTGSVLGPQWTSSLPIGQAGGDYRMMYLNNDFSSTLTDAQGDSVEFGAPPSYTPPPGYEDLSLTLTASTPTDCPGLPGGTTYYRMVDGSGDVTVFQQYGASHYYFPVCQTQPGTSNNVSYTFNASGQPTMELAPSPSGVQCTASNATSTRGCRSLSFTYATSTGAASGCPSGWGDYTGRLTSVAFAAWDPSAGAMASINVARYCYDSTGLLRAEFDPRLSQPLVTTYTYDGAGHVTTVAPPGLAAWSFGYGTIAGDGNAGRLLSVSRQDPANGLATTTVAYNVPISGTGAPYAMDSGSVSAWGQSDDPATATAIFPPDEVPTSSPPADYNRATVYYLDSWGREVDVAQPGGRIGTMEYDTHDNAVRVLTPANRAEALAAGSGSAAESKLIDTENSYAANGIDLTESLGPQHQVQLANGTQVQARQDTTYTYGDTSATAAHQPTQVTEGARVSGQNSDQDVRTTTTVYDDQAGQPTTVTADPGGLHLVHTTVYDDTTGNVIATRQPANSSGGDAHETDTVYYTAAANSTYPACGGHPEWANLACQTGPAAQPGTAGQPNMPVTTDTAYNIYNEPLTTTDTSGSATRTATTTYDPAGRSLTHAVSANDGAAAVPTVTNGYDPNTGLQTTQSASGGATITTGFDSLGRTTSYTDADGNTSTTSYDIDGRTTTTNDGKGSQTYTYDATTGDLASLQDAAAGTFTAGYNADGTLTTESYPNGMSANYIYSEAGTTTRLTYTKTTNCSSNCTWFDDQIVPSVHDQWLHERNTLTTRDYTYDNAGRLTQTEDTRAGQACVTRQYAYDADSNRTSQTSINGTGGTCAISGGTSTTHSYDSADRITDPGVTYDPMGNTLNLPAGDAGGTSITSLYFATDQLHAQTQNGVTVTYSLDAAYRVRERVTSGSKSSDVIDHFSDGSDRPAWSASGSTWTRNVQGIGGELAGIQSSNGNISLEISDLHGDVVGFVADTTTGSPTLSLTADEFGAPYNTSGNLPRYAWLGAHERTTAFPTGVVDMGAREYGPELGRFEQMDPVPGGSANAYDYANQDPVNGIDLAGTKDQILRAFNHSYYDGGENSGYIYLAGIALKTDRKPARLKITVEVFRTSGQHQGAVAENWLGPRKATSLQVDRQTGHGQHKFHITSGTTATFEVVATAYLYTPGYKHPLTDTQTVTFQFQDGQLVYDSRDPVVPSPII